jgi:hypothetical protein
MAMPTSALPRNRTPREGNSFRLEIPMGRKNTLGWLTLRARLVVPSALVLPVRAIRSADVTGSPAEKSGGLTGLNQEYACSADVLDKNGAVYSPGIGRGEMRPGI